MIISEKESKLVVNIQDGDFIIKGLKSIEEIGDYEIGEDNNFEICDVYLDNKDFLLAKQGGYLRIRGREAGHLITLRTIKKHDKKDAVIDEVTHPLDDKGVEIILEKLLENYGIRDTPKLVSPYFFEIFQSIGFNEAIRVVIDRTERDIYIDEVKIGKMKIDIFNYIQPYKLGPFFEIEVNSFKKAFHKHAGEFVAKLEDIYKEKIEASKTSKYLRGINISYGLSIQF